MTQAKKNAVDMINCSIPRVLPKLFIPASIGFLFSTLFNVVDTYYAGAISTQALSAVSLTFPVFFIIISVSVGFSTSANVLISTQLGAGKIESAKKYCCQNISFGILLSLFVTLVGLFISKPLLVLLGAQGDYLKDALDYILPVFFGSISLIMVFILNAGLSALGNNKINRNFLILGFFANLLLDPWFIYGGFGLPAFGVTGLALATVMIHCIGIVYILYHLQKTELLKKVSWKDFLPQTKYYQKILKQGLPSTFSMLSIGIYFLIINYYISGFGQEAIAAYGIGLRIEQIILIPTAGIGIAVVSLIAQNKGAGLFHRIKETYFIAMLYTGAIMLIGILLILSVANLILGSFSDDPQVIAIGFSYLYVEVFTILSYTLIHVSNSALQGLKKPNTATIINFFGRLVLPNIIFPVLIYFFASDIRVIWWGIFANSWFMAIFFIIFVRREFQRSYLLQAKMAV